MILRKVYTFTSMRKVISFAHSVKMYLIVSEKSYGILLTFTEDQLASDGSSKTIPLSLVTSDLKNITRKYLIRQIWYMITA